MKVGYYIFKFKLPTNFNINIIKKMKIYNFEDRTYEYNITQIVANVYFSLVLSFYINVYLE